MSKLKSRLSSNKRKKKFFVPRVWSNAELKKFAPLFNGKAINVSGWTDDDKEGKKYKDYFKNCNEYFISNYKSDQKGQVGLPNEIFLDLEADLEEKLKASFDIVFNHTTLEHIYEFRKAFQNLAQMTKDVLIIVVPYIQQIHGINYSDYWRFTPHAMKKLYEENGLHLHYCSANGADKASIYLFCIGFKNKEKWQNQIKFRFDLKLNESEDLYKDYTNIIGGNVI